MTILGLVWYDRMTECATTKELMWNLFCDKAWSQWSLSECDFSGLEITNCMNQMTVAKEDGRMLVGMLFLESLLLLHVHINLLKPSGFFTYHKGLTLKNSTWRSLCVECFVRISEQTATFALYVINWLAFITVVESVYCAVRTDSLYKAEYVSSLKG